LIFRKTGLQIWEWLELGLNGIFLGLNGIDFWDF
jgi:hypothetical protein